METINERLDPNLDLGLVGFHPDPWHVLYFPFFPLCHNNNVGETENMVYYTAFPPKI